MIGLDDKIDLIGGWEGEGNRENLVFRGVYLSQYCSTDRQKKWFCYYLSSLSKTPKETILNCQYCLFQGEIEIPQTYNILIRILIIQMILHINYSNNDHDNSQIIMEQF